MKRIKFEIYIGKNLSYAQADSIVAFVILPSEIPMGHYDITSNNINVNPIGFSYLSDLANYISDWLDLVEDEELISGIIYLNKQSQHLVFKGRDLINVLNLIANENNKTASKTLKEYKETII